MGCDSPCQYYYVNCILSGGRDPSIRDQHQLLTNRSIQVVPQVMGDSQVSCSGQSARVLARHHRVFNLGFQAVEAILSQ